MPTFTEFIQCPEAYSLETVIAQNPSFLDKFIQYLTVPQDPLLCNERQCYLYPSKIADVLSLGMAYRLLIEKKQIPEDGYSYPFLQKLFFSIRSQKSDPTLLGYCIRKTPQVNLQLWQIYQFIKDHQQLMIEILKDDSKLDSLREFLSLLLVESTMELYVFLKSMIVRNLIYRIVQDENAEVPVYRSLLYFYKQLVKALEDACEDEKAELVQVCKLFQDENLITLFILKLDSSHPLRNSYITQFLCMVCPRSDEVAEVTTLHIDTILDYLQEYEQSETFMESIRKDHISVLALLVELAKMNKLKADLIGQLIKRLLVYSNVHPNNTFVHNLLFTTLACCREQGKGELLNEFNILQFFIKNTTTQQLGFMALRRRVFRYWVEHHLDQEMSEEDKAIIREDTTRQQEKIGKSKYYNDFKVNPSTELFSTTKFGPDAVDPPKTGTQLEPKSQVQAEE